MNEITSFTGYYHFLSNFYIRDVRYMDRIWPSTEHAYQAMKTENTVVWDTLADPRITAGKAKRMGSKVDIRSDWDTVKIPFMREIVTAKFDQNQDLMDALLDTKGKVLIEGNTWGDRFWGQCPIGTGRNELGKILMAIRDDITRF